MNRYLLLGVLIGLLNLFSTIEIHAQNGYKLIYTFVDALTKQPIDGVNVRVLSLKDSSESVTVTGKDGETRIPLPANTEFLLRAYTKKYFSTDTLRIVTKGENPELRKTIALEKINTGVVKVLEGVRFEPNSTEIPRNAKAILGHLAKLLRLNPSITIEIAVHTDSRGDDAYNMELTQKQAEALKNYLIQLGVDAHQLVAKGFGESLLLNNCTNDVRCSSEDHLQNRRIEYVILTLD